MSPWQTTSAIIGHEARLELPVLPGVALVDERHLRPRQRTCHLLPVETGGYFGTTNIEVLFHPTDVMIEHVPACTSAHEELRRLSQRGVGSKPERPVPRQQMPSVRHQRGVSACRSYAAVSNRSSAHDMIVPEGCHTAPNSNRFQTVAPTKRLLNLQISWTQIEHTPLG